MITEGAVFIILDRAATWKTSISGLIQDGGSDNTYSSLNDLLWCVIQDLLRCVI